MVKKTKPLPEGALKLKRSLFFSWSRLDAYIFSEIHTPFFMAMLVYNSIFMIKVLSSVSKLGGGAFEVPLHIVANYFLSMLPEILLLTTSMSFLFAALAAVGRMTADSEIIAPQTTGVSFWRMSRPVLVYGAILSTILFLMANVFGPKLRINWQAKYKDYIENVALPNISPGVITAMGNNAVLYVDRVEENMLADIVFINSDDATEELLLAKRATIYTNRTIQLFDAYSLALNKKAEAGQEAVKMFQSGSLERAIPIPSGQPKGTTGSPKDLLSTDALYRIVRSEKANDPRLEAELYERLFNPFSCLIFALFVMPLAARHSRLKKGSGFGMSLFLVALYLLLTKLGRDAASQGKLLPIIATGIPPLLFLCMGLFLQMGKHRGWNRKLERWQDKIATLPMVWLRKLWKLLKKRTSRGGKTKENVSSEGTATTFVFPSKLDLLVVRSFASIYVLVQSSLLVLLMLVEYTQISKPAAKNGVGTDVILKYLLYKIPDTLQLSMFSCLLISVLILFAVMSKNMEVTAVRAGGGSLQRLCFPLVLCAICASVFSFYMENNFLPHANRLAISQSNKIKARKTALFGRDAWMKRPNGEILNYKFYDQNTKTLFGVCLYRLDADNGEHLQRMEFSQLTHNGSTWIANKGGKASMFVMEGENFYFKPKELIQGTSYDLPIKMSDLTLRIHKATEFSISELRDYLAYLKGLGYDASHYETALYAKYAQPLVPFIMMLLAMPLGFQFGRRGTFYGIGTGLIAGLVFWGLFELCKRFGSSGLIHPLAAGWTVVVIFGFIALYRFIHLE